MHNIFDMKNHVYVKNFISLPLKKEPTIVKENITANEQ